MVALIRERTTDIVNATSHLIYYMEGENDNGAHDFVKTMMDICSELRNNTNDYETFPMMKMIVDMLPGGYEWVIFLNDNFLIIILARPVILLVNSFYQSPNITKCGSSGKIFIKK